MMSLGNTEITKAYLGDTEISKIYLGEDLVFGSSIPTPILPYDAQVEYLESSGTQYIDTGIYIQCNTVELNMRYSGFANKYFCCGCRKTYRNSAFVFSNGGTSLKDYSRYFINYGTTYQTPICQNDSSIHTVVFNNICKVDGNTIATFTAVNQTASTTFWLFGTNNQDGVKYGSMRIYECKLYNNNTLSVDLIPVRVGQVGYMYDKVSGKLFGNAGTGDFIVGSDI